MGKIVVFDSGLGSLSIIQAIRKVAKADLIYFADQKNYPYGKKTSKELRHIIEYTIKSLKKKFDPDVIIVGSNTPTILFPNLFANENILGVLPPLSEAVDKTKTRSIAILGTTIALRSEQLNSYIANNVSKNILVTKIVATELIDLVETGKFITDANLCKKKMLDILLDTVISKHIDVITLSSTHLSFLSIQLQELFPKIKFLDPSMCVAKQIKKNKNFRESKRNSLKIFCSGNIELFQNNLSKLKILNKVQYLKF
jgi:glutamate racemase